MGAGIEALGRPLALPLRVALDTASLTVVHRGKSVVVYAFGLLALPLLLVNVSIAD